MTSLTVAVVCLLGYFANILYLLFTVICLHTFAVPEGGFHRDSDDPRFLVDASLPPPLCSLNHVFFFFLP